MNVPKLRFKDNNGNDYPQWKKQNLGNISDITKLAGFEFTEYVTYQDSGNIIALRGLNVKNNTLDLSDVKYIDNSDFSKLSRSKLYINDLLFTYVGTIGEVALINQNDKYYLAPNVCRIRHYDNVNAIYLLYIFNSNIIKREIYKYLTKSSQPALSMENIRKFKVSLPCLEEQNKIANFLSTVDKKISNIEDIITNLENQKKGLLQQTFNQKLRFKDENGNNYPDWKKKKLGDICKFTGGGTPSTSILKYWNGIIPWISSSDLQTNTIHKINISRYITNEAVSNSSTKIIPKNSILIVSRVGVGKVAISNCVLCTSQDFTNITEINGNTIFYAYLLKYKMEQLTQNTQGTSIKGITTSDIKNIKLIVPTEQSEQTKIADFLSAFDRKIDNQKAQLEHWKQIKKGLLQQMFV
ncbi:restriction endonuclease subunit S [Megamonas hypermegale]|uniref:restriction endonuclease subunit S n=1 Tax=Megamonas hypermegale TaxID=158847 RepID=UPI0026F26712|nr:restriction endonuclease subunit S [Megamonas hypermegale]